MPLHYGSYINFTPLLWGSISEQVFLVKLEATLDRLRGNPGHSESKISSPPPTEMNLTRKSFTQLENMSIDGYLSIY